MGQINMREANMQSGTRSKVDARRRQWLTSAGKLFYLYGYQEVTVADIAQRNGVTAGALYRHFPDKQSLLVESVRSVVLAWPKVIDAAFAKEADPPAAIKRIAHATAKYAVSNRFAIGLRYREYGSIPADVRHEMAASRNRSIGLWTRLLGEIHPELNDEELDFRIRIALGALNCAPELRSTPAKKLSVQLASVIEAAIYIPRVPRSATNPIPSDGDSSHDSAHRADVIRANAARLIRERGYTSVGMDDLGEASGIAGPSVYKHYKSKSDILHAILVEICDLLMHGTELQDTATPHEALEALVRSHVESAIDLRDYVAIFTTESHRLPTLARRDVNRRRQSYVDLWTDRLRDVRPDISRQEASVSSAAVMAMIDTLARSDRLRKTPYALETTVHMALAALLTSP